MASKKKLARIEAASNKANSSPPKDTLPQEWYDDTMSEFEHRPDPDYPGFCWCGRGLEED